MTRWFRHYAGLCRDDKLVRVALKSKQPVERVVWIWAAILESAAEIDDHGKFDFDIGEAAYFLRSAETDVEAVYSALRDMGRIVETSVAKWDERQFVSDRSAERQKRYRDKRKSNYDHNADGEVTSPSRHRDAPELETELELEPETEKKERLPLAIARSSSAKAADTPAASEEAFREALAAKAGADAKRKAKADLCQDVVALWNDTASGLGLRTVADITEQRQAAIIARSIELVKTYDHPDPIAGWGALMGLVRESKFLRGEKTDFKASFDFVVNKSKFTKIMERNYEG